jgi:hypothetical protein
MIIGEVKEIDAQISIIASYDDKIMIRVYDATSNLMFLEMELTNEQFVNAAMNRLSNTTVKRATVDGLNLVGKRMEREIYEFPIPSFPDINYAVKHVKEKFENTEWYPDTGFGNQNSFFNRDGKYWARTTIRRWVE